MKKLKQISNKFSCVGLPTIEPKTDFLPKKLFFCFWRREENFLHSIENYFFILQPPKPYEIYDKIDFEILFAARELSVKNYGTQLDKFLLFIQVLLCFCFSLLFSFHRRQRMLHVCWLEHSSVAFHNVVLRIYVTGSFYWIRKVLSWLMKPTIVLYFLFDFSYQQFQRRLLWSLAFWWITYHRDCIIFLPSIFWCSYWHLLVIKLALHFHVNVST